GPRQPGPACDLYCRRLRRGCRPVNREGSDLFRLAAVAVRRRVKCRVKAVIGHGPQPQPEREPPIWRRTPPVGTGPDGTPNRRICAGSLDATVRGWSVRGRRPGLAMLPPGLVGFVRARRPLVLGYVSVIRSSSLCTGAPASSRSCRLGASATAGGQAVGARARPLACASAVGG